MATTSDTLEERREAHWREAQAREEELATLSAHLSAATARWLELVWELREQGDADDLAGFVAYRFGITGREAREYLRVAEALTELPAIREAFSRGELTYTKVRALTRVATGPSEERLLDLAGLLTASQLERTLRVFRRPTAAETRERQALEFVDWRFEEDGSLSLRARLAGEDGTVLVKALEAARERVVARLREERAAAGEAAGFALDPPRPARVEALLELAEGSLAAAGGDDVEPARLVVHVDAAALQSDGPGRCDLERGPVLCPETARRLGCDAELVTQIERDGLPVTVGRRRRTVPPTLRRLLAARDHDTCCFPGCERDRRLQAHHRRHWAHGGETSLDNLILLCWQHHRLVHENGYTIEDDPDRDGLRFRNRHGVVHPAAPPRPPPGDPDRLRADNTRRGLVLGPRTSRHGCGDPLHLADVVDAIARAVGQA